MVTLDEKEIQISLKNSVTVRIFGCNHARFAFNENEIFLLTKKNQIKMIGTDISRIEKLEFDKVVILNLGNTDLELLQAYYYLLELAEEASLKLETKLDKISLSSHILKIYRQELDDALQALSSFGIKLEKKKYVTAKAQHRWKKSIADIEFHLNRKDASATIFWQKSNEMLIKAGAKMAADIPLLKDGSIGFGARFALNIREEQKDKWNPENYTTTEDIIVKSVNEMGHFLYFAGTNSWLELFDAEGRTIHELTVV